MVTTNIRKVLKSGMVSGSTSTVIKSISLAEQRSLAMRRDTFREQDNHTIKQILRNDLLLYMEGADIKRMKLITLDFFIPAFLKKICNVYDTPPLIKLAEGKDGEKLIELLNEVDAIPAMAETFERMRLHNTVMSHLRYNTALDKLSIDSRYNASNTFVIPDESDSTEWQALAYIYKVEEKETRWVVWDRMTGEHYFITTTKDFPEFNQETRFADTRHNIGKNKDFDGPNYGGKNIMPWVVYR